VAPAILPVVVVLAPRRFEPSKLGPHRHSCLWSPYQHRDYPGWASSARADKSVCATEAEFIVC
jgi:hypothetical protein